MPAERGLQAPDPAKETDAQVDLNPEPTRSWEAHPPVPVQHPQTQEGSYEQAPQREKHGGWQGLTPDRT